MKFIAQIFLIICLMVMSQVIGAEDVARVELAADVFIAVPKNIFVSKSVPVGDFSLYDFRHESLGSFLRAYVGNFPSFPSEACISGKSEEIEINGIRAKMIDCQGDVMKVEFLFSLPSKSWPQFIHFMLQRSDETGKQGLNIVQSIQRQQRKDKGTSTNY